MSKLGHWNPRHITVFEQTMWWCSDDVHFSSTCSSSRVLFDPTHSTDTRCVFDGQISWDMILKISLNGAIWAQLKRCWGCPLHFFSSRLPSIQAKPSWPCQKQGSWNRDLNFFHYRYHLQVLGTVQFSLSKRLWKDKIPRPPSRIREYWWMEE